MQVYGGTKLLQDDDSGPRKRGRHGNDHQLLPDTDINGVFATEGDSDAERHGRGRDNGEHSSDEGLITPKKVSTQTVKLRFVLVIAYFCGIVPTLKY